MQKMTRLKSFCFFLVQFAICTLQFAIHHPADAATTISARVGKVIPAGAGQGYWRKHNLPGSIGVQDREGNIWFHSLIGANRYNGQTWTTFTTQDGLVDDRIREIYADQEGMIWFSTESEKGITRYDPKKERDAWTTFTTQDGLTDNSVWSMFQDREGIHWFGTNTGLCRYDKKTWQTVNSKRVLAIFQDQRGALWFGTSDEGIIKYTPSDGVWQTFTISDGLAANTVSSIAQDQEGNLWFGHAWFRSRNHGATQYDGHHFTIVTMADGLVDNSVEAILQNRDGALWFGTENGLSIYRAHTWTTVATDAKFSALMQDKEGNLWAGTTMYDHRFLSLTEQDGLALNSVWTLYVDRDNHVWTGTMGEGVCRYDGQTFTVFSQADGLASNWVYAILQDRGGNFWFGTEKGLNIYDGKSLTTVTAENGIVQAQIWSLFQDQKGNIWVGTQRGIGCYDGTSWTTFTTEDGLVNNFVENIFQDRKGNFWFATRGGVSCYDGSRWITYTTQDGLADDRVWQVFQDREEIFWFGTRNGLTRFDGQRFTTYTHRDGLPGNDIRSIVQDKNGHLWFAIGAGGVSQHDGQVFQNMTVEDGLSAIHVRKVSMDQVGNIWFATTKGITRFQSGKVSPPPIVIESVVADRRYEKQSEITVPSTTELIAFEFRGTSFKTRPDALIYRYRLTEYDNNWHTTQNRRIEYQNLSWGTYTFEIVAVDRDLVYSEKPATITLTIHPPYERIGLWSALGMALLLIAWQATKVIHSNRQLQNSNAALSDANHELFHINVELEKANTEIQQQSERKSAFLASMSHELRTPMNAIKGFTNLVLRRAGDVLPEQQKDNLKKVDQASNHLLAMINDLLDLSKIEAGRMDVTPTKFRIHHVIAHCVSTVSPLVKDGVNLSYDIADDIGEAYTDETRLRQMVINLLSNAIKFTDVGEVKVTVTSHESRVTSQETDPIGLGGGLATHDPRPATDFIEIAVSDTGKGIPTSELSTIFDEYRQVKGSESTVQKGTGLGLSITKKFAELLGGRIDVESELEKGSTFTVRIPVTFKGEK